MNLLAKDKIGDIELILIKNKKLPKNLSKAEKDSLDKYDFDGSGSCMLLEYKKFFIGIDDCGYEFPNAIRDSISQAIQKLKSLKINSISIEASSESELKEICEGFLLGNYSFDSYKTKKSKNHIKEIYIQSTKLTKTQIENQISQSKIITESINKIRELINTPPQDATPNYVANFAHKIAKDSNISCKIHDSKFLKKENMEAFLAVAKASINEPFMVHLHYKPNTKKKVPKIALVGKGLTYDSGGLSLKPGDYMTTMKADKSGACAVIGILEIVAKLKLEVEVHGILGLAENMIGGNAYKPDDILTARNKKTIEVRNTDAEGRLVLADCLSYASDLKPDYLIDLATLTGACVVALGDYTIGIMGYNQKLKENFAKHAFNAGELSGILPFNPYLKKLYSSEVADLCNIPSSRYGSAISAGMFLGEFVSKDLQDKWIHLDIAGPAYVEKSWGVNPFGATGAGVRACVEFIRNIKE
ncbi:MULTISPECIES: leucyl aminopeptidase [Helicobacter]|uniref:Probable cytosol aminopeptidase n=1 Tax=Helicobacter ibis TaxID=2962633 RepID=A0ABT4VCX4_9HELI|nr:MULTISPECIES: leucyl aminopeptidase [Helicobacter]MDA3966678.1 leucyl aminopeptidase [Helicobacter sp. WB40]MDA3968554.1 leucyl aminopeptidase [Helicobacter ibis]